MRRTLADPSDDDLNAFIDGELEPDRRDEIGTFIADDAETAAYVDALRHQDQGLRTLGDAVLHEPVPERLRAIVRGGATAVPPAAAPVESVVFSRKTTAAVVMAAAVGITLGWFAKDVASPESDTLLGPYTEQAVLSHRLFETNRDFETVEDDRGAIVIDETVKPFSTPVRVPTMRIAGLTPVIVRHVEGEGGNSVHIAYDNGDGGWTSLYIRQHSNDTRLPFRFEEREGYSVLYWLDGPLVYALVGTEGEDALRKIAEAIYRAPATSDLNQRFDAHTAAPVIAE